MERTHNLDLGEIPAGTLPSQEGVTAEVGSGNYFEISGSFPPCAVWHAGYTVIAEGSQNKCSFWGPGVLLELGPDRTVWTE